MGLTNKKSDDTRRSFFNRFLGIFALGSIAAPLAAKTNKSEEFALGSRMGVEPYLGEIALYPYNFAPRGWAFCQGQLLAISQYSALFSLLGTTYGGDGRTTFGLPDLRGRVAFSSGNGPGLSNHQLGSRGGSERNTLQTVNLPPTNNTANVTGAVNLPVGGAADTDSPSGAYLAEASDDLYASAPASGEFGGALQNNLNVSITGGGNSTPVNNMQPYLTLNYCIALQGVFPSRS